MFFWSPTKPGHTITAAFPEIQEDRIYPSRKTSDAYTPQIRNIKHAETKFPSLSDNCVFSENHFFSRNPSKEMNRTILSLPNYQNDRLSTPLSSQEHTEEQHTDNHIQGKAHEQPAYSDYPWTFMHPTISQQKNYFASSFSMVSIRCWNSSAV